MTDGTANIEADLSATLLNVVRRHWGYDALRPLQAEAMAAAVGGRDALVVLPTGGGKSLCYQVPALLSDKLTVVVSPLISLMKDQVDALQARQIPAAYLNSSLDPGDRRRVMAGVEGGQYRLLFVSPERICADGFLDLLAGAHRLQTGATFSSGATSGTRATSGRGATCVGAFAIDEAHCISHWGHDFRAEYRRMEMLKQRFPATPVHAFTATATPRVRQDIVAQLGLADPLLLVGDFFRPNLTYVAQRRVGGFGAVIDAVLARRGKAGIVYCIRRQDVDDVTAHLQAEGIQAAAYHAGLSDGERVSAQDSFSAGRIDVVVATVAFGMGIDRADIRYVIHAACPKSMEHYQQETGRAGRDGLPAECILFYSGADFQLWRHFISQDGSEHAGLLLDMLGEMERFCSGASCRHRRLVEYFGQHWTRGSCEACDFCQGGRTVLPDATVTAQKIMSCVARTGQRFGAAHVADVLVGSATERVVQRGHDKLSTFNLLAGQPKAVVTEWINQLVDQGLLLREGEYRTLALSEAGWEVLRSEAEAQLFAVEDSRAGNGGARQRLRRRPPPAPRTPSPIEPPRPLNFDEQSVFDRLKAVRRQLAEELNTAAFMVFSDKTLRELARARPTSREAMLAVKGVGPRKVEAFGELFLAAIQSQE